MTLSKLNLGGLIVVEGRDDKFLLEQIVNDPIYVLHGYSGVSENRLNKLKELSKNKKVFLLLDPDFAGKKMRNILKNNLENTYDICIPRKNSIKKNDIGIENVEINYLYNYLKKYSNKDYIIDNNYEYTIYDLIEHKLTGDINSKKNREYLGDKLNIGYFNSKSLLKTLNKYKISKKLFDDIMKKNNTNIGVIFGKFLPAHKGHINFILKASEMVDKLIVFLCVEKERDDKLLENSTLPYKVTVEDRYNILKEELKDRNIEILILDEEGIDYYPNGWKSWSDRVKDVLKNNNLEINTIFTNEKQDIENYYKYFDNIEVVYFDLNRDIINVSSTKIRTEYSQYKDYLTDYAKSIIQKNFTKI